MNNFLLIRKTETTSPFEVCLIYFYEHLNPYSPSVHDLKRIVEEKVVITEICTTFDRGLRLDVKIRLSIRSSL